MGYKKLWVAVTISFLFTTPVHSAQRAESLEAKLAKRVGYFRLSESNLPRALITVASQFEIPLGIEWEEPAKAQRVNYSRQDTTVLQILEDIVKRHGGYQIVVGPEMVHVFYAGALEDKSNFTNIRLNRFVVSNRYVALALRDLHDRVNEIVTRTPRGSDRFGHTLLEPNDIRITMEFKDTTVREILDSLALRSGHRIWAVSFPQSAGLTAGGFRRTFTLWNNVPVPDADQPIWDRFVWGRALPPDAMQHQEGVMR